MAGHRLWETYPPTYRAKEMKILAKWIAANESGSVVGLAGCGRSHLLGFLCHRPEVLQAYLPPRAGPTALISVDLNNLPANDLSTLYRIMLRAFYLVRDRFDPTLQQTIIDLYLENRTGQDPFVSQSALHDLLLLFQDQQMQVVLVLNRFDRFCETATPHMLNTLRGLRDSFRNTLCYLAGMRQEVAYLPDPAALGDMYDILDSHVCWVGAMNEADARQMLTRITRSAPNPPAEAEATTMVALGGRFPALLKAIGDWWQTSPNIPPMTEWAERLQAEGSIRYRLDRMWAGLTQEEQLALSEIQKLQVQVRTAQDRTRACRDLTGQHHYALDRLAVKGLCEQVDAGWQIAGDLLLAYVAQAEGRSRGKIWPDEKTKTVYQGQRPIEDLTTLQREVLYFLVKNPRMRHTKTDLIVNTWPDELREEGVSDNSLYQVIRELRKRIEPNLTKPRYLVNWRGRPEGGYQFFPEGKPA